MKIQGIKHSIQINFDLLLAVKRCKSKCISSEFATDFWLFCLSRWWNEKRGKKSATILRPLILLVLPFVPCLKNALIYCPQAEDATKKFCSHFAPPLTASSMHNMKNARKRPDPSMWVHYLHPKRRPFVLSNYRHINLQNTANLTLFRPKNGYPSSAL